MAFSNNSIKFDGVYGYVDAEYQTLLNFDRTDAFSISCWTKTKSTNSINTILSKMDGSTGTGYILFLNGSGQFEVILRNTPVTDSLRVRTVADGYNEGGWHHFVMTYDGSGNIVLYVDGLPKVTTTVYNTLASSIKNYSLFQVGAYDGANLFDGSIDEVAVYADVLSANNVLNLFGSAKPTNQSDVVSGYSPLTTSIHFNNGTTDESVSFANYPTFEWSDPFSLGIWVKMTAGTAQRIMDKKNGALNYQGWELQVSAGNDIKFLLDNGPTIATATFGYNLADDTWHHVLIRYDGSGNSANVRCSVDGVDQGSPGAGGSFSSGSILTSNPLTIGQMYPGWTNSVFTGRACHSAIWDKTLSAEEATEVYGDGTPIDLLSLSTATNLVHWCPLGDGCSLGSGNFPDLSIAGNDGTFNNGDSGDFVSDVPLAYILSKLLMWWRMGDGDTYPVLIDQIVAPYAFPTAYDLSGNGYHGTATNMEAADAVRDVPRTDFCKYSVIFDGSTNYITMGNVLNFERTDQFSISFWMKFVSAGTVAVSKMGPSLFQGYAVWAGSGINFQLADGSGSVQVETGNVGMADGEWHHCVVTWDGDVAGGAAGALCYIDGSLRSTTTTTDTLTGSMLNTASFRVGGRELGPLYYGGNITEVAVYDSELSAADVEWIYNDGLPRDLLDGYAPSNIVAWWRVGTIDQTNWQTRDLIWGSSAETSQISDMSRLANHATATNTEAGDFTTDTPGGEAQYSVNLNDHLFSTRSIDFDGTGDYITMGSAFDFDHDDPFSISCWFKTSTGSGYLVTKADNSVRGYGLWVTPTGQLRFYFLNSLTILVDVYTTNTFIDNKWHHVVLTHSGSGTAAGMTIYIDGVNQAPLTVVTNNLAGNTTLNSASFNISGRTDGSYLFTGSIDEVSIYDKELTVGEVSSIYNSGDPTDLSLLASSGNLIGWWRMGEGDIYPTIYDHGLVPQPFAYPKIFDMSGYDNHGTMTNMEIDDSVPDHPRGAFTKYSVDFSSGQYITMGNESELDFDSTHVFSLSCWFNTTQSTDGTLISKMEGSPYKGYLLYVRSGGKIAFRLINTWNTNLIDVETTTTWNDGEWHHVTLVYDGSQSAAGVTIYIDGVSEGLSTIFDTLSATTLNTATFRLAYRHSNEYPYVGKMADAVVYNIGLSAADASWMYNSGVPLDLRDGYDDGDGYNDGYIVGYWRIGNGHDELGYIKKIQDWVWGDVATKETTTITDASFLTNDLTLTNVDADEVTPETPGGISNYSCYFNGVDSFAYTALGTAHYGIDNGDVLSLSGWVKTTSSDAFDYLWGNAASGTTKAGYHVYLAAGKPTFEMAANDLTAVKLIEQTTSATVNDGYWHHIVFTEYYVSNNNYVVSCYIDGVSVALTNLNNGLGTSAIGGSGFSVGGRGASGDDPIDGYIDEVSVYRKSLTQSDVTSIYNAGAPVDLRALSSSMHMMGWWRMGDSYGIVGTAVNTTAAGKNGDVPGAVIYSSKSLRFDVTNEYVNIGNPSELNFDVADPFSISVWVKDSQQASYQGVVGKITGGVGWYLRVYNNTITSQANSFLQFVMDGTGLIEVYMADRRGAFPYNEWVNVVVTYDGSNDGTGVKFYMNGELYPTYVYQNTANATILNAANFTAGLANGSYNLGNMDELSVWDKELSQTDVTAIWNGGDPANLSSHASVANLAGWWRMTDGLGPIDGTMTNMSSDDINGDVPVSSPEYLITAAGSSSTDFGAAYNYRWTVGAWIKTNNEFGVIVNKNYSTDFSGWGMRLLGGYPTLWWANNPPGLLTEQRSDARIDDGYWHHVMAIRILPSGGAPTCKFYVDGALTGTVTIQNTNAGNTISNTGTVAIGFAKGSGEGEQPFIGKIAEVAIWRGDFSTAEVIEAYNGGAPPNLIDLHSEPKLRGWWRCGDDNGNPGTYTNFATTAKLGDAPGEEYSTSSFDLDGSNEYVAIDSGIAYERTDAFSVSCWFKTQSRNEWPMSQMSTYGWYLDELDNTPYWRMEGATGAIRIYFGYEDIIWANEWYHMVITYDGSSTAAGTKMYIDGIEIPAVNVASDTLAGSIAGGTINIGNREGVYFNGQVDDASIWSKALSSAEVVEIYNGGVPANLTRHSAIANLDGWWKLGEDNGNDGTMINMLSGNIVLNAPREAGAIGEQIDYFLMRGIDSACGTLTYYYWLVTETPDFLGAQVDAGDLPCGGPLIDIVVAASWSVIN